jgi:hypothetical protein
LGFGICPIFGVYKNKQNTINMELYLLKNGNTIKIENDYYRSYDNTTKVTFDMVHVQKDGYWKHRETETINLSYYNSIDDYIRTNYETI